MYASDAARAVLLLAWLSALVSAFVLERSGAWFQGDIALVGLGLALGGGAGNLLDVLRHRSIVDFIDLGWWPVFNVADVAIIGGLILALGSRA
jgi:signal peptidase II